jgi:hypothetical protein
MLRWNWENHSDCEGQDVGLTRPTPFANDAPSSTPAGYDSDNAEQKGPKADQAAGRLSLRFTLVEFTSRGSDLLVGLYFYS